MTTYERLAERIRKRITSGELSAGERLEPLRKIAAKEGLCVTTVCKAVDVLSKEGLVKRIDRKGIYVAKLKEPPSPVKKVGIWGPFSPSILLNDRDSAFLRAALVSFQDEVQKAGVRTSIHNCHATPESFDGTKAWRYVMSEEIADYGLDALYVPGIYNFHYLSSLATLRLPMAAFDVNTIDLGIDCAYLDNVGAAFELTRLLIDKGHKRIAFLGGPMSHPYGINLENYDPSARERALGYRMALRYMAPDLKEIVYHNTQERRGSDTTATAARLMSDVPDCTAIVSESLLDLRSVGGGHIEIAGFGPQGSLKKHQNPAVIAIAEANFDELSRAAARMLLARIERPEMPVNSAVFQPKVEVRGK